MTKERSPDEIMAEHLLKGGKMLSKTCPVCYSPLFEYKGETLCVVCQEEQKTKSTDSGPIAGAVPASPKGQVRAASSAQEAPGGLEEEFALTIGTLLREAREERDSARILTLMDAVKHGAEAYALLLYGYGRRDNS